jgi:hypothetical protein
VWKKYKELWMLMVEGFAAVLVFAYLFLKAIIRYPVIGDILITAIVFLAITAFMLWIFMSRKEQEDE